MPGVGTPLGSMETLPPLVPEPPVPVPVPGLPLGSIEAPSFSKRLISPLQREVKMPSRTCTDEETDLIISLESPRSLAWAAMGVRQSDRLRAVNSIRDTLFGYTPSLLFLYGYLLTVESPEEQSTREREVPFERQIVTPLEAIPAGRF